MRQVKRVSILQDTMSTERSGNKKIKTSYNIILDGSQKSPGACHCEERSDAAISLFQALTKAEIASLRSQ